MIESTTIARMKTVKEIRLENARWLAKDGPAEFARAIESTTQQVNQFMGPNPTRNIGDTIARRIESAFGKPVGWLDVEHIRPKSGIPISGGEFSFLPESDSSTAGETFPGKLATPQERLKAAIPADAIPELLARAVGVDVAVASKWLDGVGPEITLAQAAAIQEAYGINMVWLTKGKGAPGVAIRYADEWKPIPITEMYGVPVRGMAQLGDNGHWVDIDYPDGVGEGYVDIPKKNRDTYAIKCVGDSMKPRIKNGEYVVIEPSVPYQPGDEVLVKAKDGRVMIKIFLYERLGRVHLVSVNENHPPISIESDKIEKIHYVASINKPTQWRPD